MSSRVSLAPIGPVCAGSVGAFFSITYGVVTIWLHKIIKFTLQVSRKAHWNEGAVVFSNLLRLSR